MQTTMYITCGWNADTQPVMRIFGRGRTNHCVPSPSISAASNGHREDVTYRCGSRHAVCRHGDATAKRTREGRGTESGCNLDAVRKSRQEQGCSQCLTTFFLLRAAWPHGLLAEIGGQTR
jgi:hypothetical protein